MKISDKAKEHRIECLKIADRFSQEDLALLMGEKSLDYIKSPTHDNWKKLIMATQLLMSKGAIIYKGSLESATRDFEELEAGANIIESLKLNN